MRHNAKFRNFLCVALLFLLFIPGCAIKKPLLSRPIQPLDCIEAAYAPIILPHEDGKMLACWTDYEENKTYLRVIDIGADKVIAFRDLPGSWSVQGGPFTDGSYALFNWNDHTWKFIDSALSDEKDLLQLPSGGLFSHDRSSYYFLQDNILCCKNMASGEAARVPLAFDMRFSSLVSISPASDTLVLHCLLSPYDYQSGTAVLNPATGAYSLLQENFYLPSFGHNNTLNFLQFDDTTMESELLYTDHGGKCRLVGANILGGTENILLPVDGSPYLLAVGQSSVLFRLDETLASFPLPDEVTGGTPCNLYWLPADRILIGCVYDNSAFHLFAADPAQLPFTAGEEAPETGSPFAVNTELPRRYWTELYGQPLPKPLRNARQYANHLEEQYGITILLSAQAASACTLVSDAVITTTDKAQLDDEPQAIMRMLEALEQTLALYPDGFFRQLRNSMGEGGVRIMPVAHIENDVNAIGLTYETDGGWQNIAIDVQLTAFDGVICHELWHATENVIRSRAPECLDAKQWAKYNPPGYLYQNQRVYPDPDSNRWTFFGSDSEDIYFVDDYARTDSREDRARIMEYIMTSEDFAGPLMQSPAIVHKLQYMCQAIRTVFDTSAWDTPYWERLLNE